MKPRSTWVRGAVLALQIAAALFLERAIFFGPQTVPPIGVDVIDYEFVFLRLFAVSLALIALSLRLRLGWVFRFVAPLAMPAILYASFMREPHGFSLPFAMWPRILLPMGIAALGFVAWRKSRTVQDGRRVRDLALGLAAFVVAFVVGLLPGYFGAPAMWWSEALRSSMFASAIGDAVYAAAFSLVALRRVEGWAVLVVYVLVRAILTPPTSPWEIVEYLVRFAFSALCTWQWTLGNPSRRVDTAGRIEGAATG